MKRSEVKKLATIMCSRYGKCQDCETYPKCLVQTYASRLVDARLVVSKNEILKDMDRLDRCARLYFEGAVDRTFFEFVIMMAHNKYKEDPDDIT